MWQPVDPAWFQGPTLRVARRLLGMVVVHEGPDGITASRIVEVEAYRGPEDRAAHSSGGRLTRRTAVMFGPAGHAYVYQIYGLHFCLNVVTREDGKPEAVLLRAGEPLQGLPLMAARRRLGSEAPPRLLASGPARLVQAMGIHRSDYGHPLWESPLFIAEGHHIARTDIASGPRIGVDYAGRWAEKPWRFWIRGNPHVSR